MNLPTFKTITKALLLVIAGVTSAQNEVNISPDEAKNHIGEIAMVCGAIVGIRREHQTYNPEFKQQSASPSNLSLITERTILFFEKLPPHHVFMAIFDDAIRQKISEEPESFVDRKACVYGKIQNYKAKQVIVLARPDQLAVEQVRKSAKYHH